MDKIWSVFDNGSTVQSIFFCFVRPSLLWLQASRSTRRRPELNLKCLQRSSHLHSLQNFSIFFLCFPLICSSCYLPRCFLNFKSIGSPRCGGKAVIAATVSVDSLRLWQIQVVQDNAKQIDTISGILMICMLTDRVRVLKMRATSTTLEFYTLVERLHLIFFLSQAAVFVTQNASNLTENMSAFFTRLRRQSTIKQEWWVNLDTVRALVHRFAFKKTQGYAENQVPTSSDSATPLEATLDLCLCSSCYTQHALLMEGKLRWNLGHHRSARAARSAACSGVIEIHFGTCRRARVRSGHKFKIASGVNLGSLRA